MENDLYENVYIKYKSFIKNDLLYFTDTIFYYFDCTVPDEHEISILKIKINSDIFINNRMDILEVGKSKYIIGFLYPSELMEKENTYNFKKFWIYTNEHKKELRLSSFTIINDIIIKKNSKNNKNNIKFDKDEVEDIFIIRVKDLIDSQNKK
jgi:hypothetical protein